MREREASVSRTEWEIEIHKTEKFSTYRRRARMQASIMIKQIVSEKLFFRKHKQR